MNSLLNSTMMPRKVSRRSSTRNEELKKCKLSRRSITPSQPSILASHTNLQGCPANSVIWTHQLIMNKTLFSLLLLGTIFAGRCFHNGIASPYYCLPFQKCCPDNDVVDSSSGSFGEALWELAFGSD